MARHLCCSSCAVLTSVWMRLCTLYQIKTVVSQRLDYIRDISQQQLINTMNSLECEVHFLSDMNTTQRGRVSQHVADNCDYVCSHPPFQPQTEAQSGEKGGR